jgi:hypothetical protein
MKSSKLINYLFNKHVLKPALGACTTTTVKPIKSKEQFPSNVKFLSRKKYTRMGLGGWLWDGNFAI